jgi:hypothetical protein
MGLIAFGALALLALVWLGRGGDKVLKQRGWRITSGAFALAALAGAALLAFREAFIPAAGLLGVSLWLAMAARRNSAASAPPPPPASSRRMTLDEARSILGVGVDATPAEIRAAHKRLIRRAHPDAGGTSGLAAQLNAARDRLLADFED